MAKKTMQAITKENSYGRRMVPEYLIEKLEKAPAKLVASGSIKDLTTDEINDLQAGDIVVKTTGDQKHTYIVTYKEEGQGICLSYFNAGYSETVSFDYIDGEWVYNSTDISNTNLIEEIRDSEGNLRFVEGKGIPNTISGVTTIYNKWSLSGSHLMFVFAFKVDANTPDISSFSVLADYSIPEWIMNKIYPLFSDVMINFKSEYIKNYGTSGYSSTQFVLSKVDGKIRLQTLDTIELSANNRVCRVQFDLLIDNE